MSRKVRPNILVLQSNDDLCAQVTALLSEYFTVHVCKSPTQVFSTLDRHPCDFALICKRFCNPVFVDWSELLRKLNKIPSSNIFVSTGELNDVWVVNQARESWIRYNDSDPSTISRCGQLIETALHALNVQGHWA